MEAKNLREAMRLEMILARAIARGMTHMPMGGESTVEANAWNTLPHCQGEYSRWDFLAENNLTAGGSWVIESPRPRSIDFFDTYQRAIENLPFHNPSARVRWRNTCEASS